MFYPSGAFLQLVSFIIVMWDAEPKLKLIQLDHFQKYSKLILWDRLGRDQLPKEKKQNLSTISGM